MHADFFKQPETLSFTTVLHVTEVKTRDKDPEAEVGCLFEELGQSGRAVCTGRPGAEPGDGVADPPLPMKSIPR